jgi:hypothetical protein
LWTFLAWENAVRCLPVFGHRHVGLTSTLSKMENASGSSSRVSLSNSWWIAISSQMITLESRQWPKQERRWSMRKKQRSALYWFVEDHWYLSKELIKVVVPWVRITVIA